MESHDPQHNAAPTNPPVSTPVTDEIDIETFAKIKFRVATIEKVEQVPKSKKASADPTGSWRAGQKTDRLWHRVALHPGATRGQANYYRGESKAR